MKKYLLALLLALSSTAWAHRFPIDSMEVAVLKSASFPQVTLTTDGFSWLRTLTLGWLDDGAKTVDMVQGVRIKDENNRFITHGQLQNYTGRIVDTDSAGKRGIQRTRCFAAKPAALRLDEK